MVVEDHIAPDYNERPTEFSNRLGCKYIHNISREHKAKFGQYLTPVSIADYMSSLASVDMDEIYILDPGAGIGVLSCSLCERLANNKHVPKTINLVAYENDSAIIKYLDASLEYLCQWLTDQNIELTYKILSEDFVLAHSEAIEHNGKFAVYDIVISNPPYFKIPKSDPRAMASISVIHGQPNMYSLFMAVSAKLLKQNGQLIFITPRSFTAGLYFRLFRERFFTLMRPEYIHSFISRTKAFNKDAVLQENIILKAVRESEWTNVRRSVTIAHSEGADDLQKCDKLTIGLDRIIDMNSKSKTLRIPISEKEERIVELMNSWQGTLHSYGLQI